MKALYILFLALVVAFAACERQEAPGEQAETTTTEVKEKAGEFLTAAKDYTVEQREEYEQLLADNIDSMKTKLADLKQQVEEAGEEQTQELEEKIQENEQKIQAMQQGLDSLKQAGDDAWENVKSGLVEKWSGVKEAAKDVQAEAEKVEEE